VLFGFLSIQGDEVRLGVGDALRRGFRAVLAFPVLILFPLLWDVAQLGLAYLGFPAAAGWPDITLGQPGATATVRAFLPTAFPSVANLKLQIAPAMQPLLTELSPWMALLTLVGMPLAEAVIQAAFFAMLAEALTGPGPTVATVLGRARRSFPALFALQLFGRLGPLLLPKEALAVWVGVSVVFYPLLWFAIGVLDLPLATTLMRAPGLLWSRIGRWLGLGLATWGVTLLFTGAWTLLGNYPTLALLLYPALATALVASAAALCLDRDPILQNYRVGHPLWGVVVLVAALVGALLAGGWMEAWKGWVPTRDAALSGPGSGSTTMAMMFPPQRGQTVYVLPQPEGELVLYRPNPGALGLAALRRGRFGWQFMSNQTWGSSSELAPVVAMVSSEPTGGGRHYDLQWVAAGEIFDSRVAYIQVQGERHPVGQDGPYFLVQLNSPPQGPVTALDAAGNPVPNREVKKP